jgi:nondiscriminating glutamyl-tRNA synthetase
VLSAFADEIRKREAIRPEDISPIGKAVQKAAGVKGQDLYMPIRVAVTGRLHGPELAKALPLLGKAECLRRIERVLEKM